MAGAPTEEPVHIDELGVERPGSQSLTSVVTPTSIAKADAAWDEHYADSEVRNMQSSLSPHIIGPYSPLETLIENAFIDYGNMSVDTLDGTLKRMMLRWANRIVEHMRIHPYFSIPDLDYYTSLQDTRPIPDMIVELGILYHYAKWSKSTTAGAAMVEYMNMASQILYQRKYGKGKIQMNTVDKTSVVQGLIPTQAQLED